MVFVPVYFGYERLLEGRAFTSELAGGKKQRESLLALFKSLKTLREDYGNVYVNVGEPIALSQLLDQQKPDWRSETVTDERPDWIKPVVDRLGIQIMRSINEAACVTPISLLATTLLATPKGCIARAELRQQIQLYQLLLKSAHDGTHVVVPDIDPANLIEHGMQLGFIDTHIDEVGPVVTLKEAQAAPLTYFRNNILHLLTLPALIAAAFTQNRSRSHEELRALVTLTFPFIQGELFLTTELEEQAIDQTLDALQQAGLIHQNNEHWQRAPAGTAEAVALMRLAQVVMPALERNFLCAVVLAGAAQSAIERGDLAHRCEIGAQRLAKTHGHFAGDLFDKHLHRSFVDNLAQRGYLSIEEGRLSPTSMLLNLEAEARSLLGEQTRHAIINVAIATQSAEKSSAGAT